MKTKSARVLASASGGATSQKLPGCQEIATSASAKAPARTMKALAAPPSSAGQP